VDHVGLSLPWLFLNLGKLSMKEPSEILLNNNLLIVLLLLEVVVQVVGHTKP
jgi:hypothetical protein